MSRIDVRSGKNGQYVKPYRTPVVAGTTTPTTDTPHLAFNMPDLTAYRNTKYVMPHQFFVYPRNENDTWPDYYSGTQWPPGAIEGAGQSWAVDHRPYGGKIRNRLMPRGTPLGVGTPAYYIADLKTELQWAIDAGFDGFFLELLTTKSTSWSARATYLCDAHVQLNPPSWFKHILQADGSASFCQGRTPEAAADETADWLRTYGTAVFRQIGGKFVISPYGGEFVSYASGKLAYWTAYKNRLLNTHGYDILLWFCYSADWVVNAPTFDGIAYGHGRWGSRDPVQAAGANNQNANAPAYCHNTYAKPWMHFAAPQDNRAAQGPPYGPLFSEAGATDLLRTCMEAATAGASEAIIVPTWNDFYEASGIGPSVHAEFCWLDVLQYWLVKYKTGSYPTIVRDTCYLTHRIHDTSVDTTAEVQSTYQTTFMKITGSTPARNEGEVLCFATTTASTNCVIERDVNNNGTWTAYQTTALTSTVHPVKFPLATGKFRAKLVRSGVDVAGTSVVSREAVVTKPLVQDLDYRITSSRRPTTVWGATPPSVAKLV